MIRPNFLEINFAYTDAGEELTYAPELIERAFVDINHITTAVMKPNIFMVHGPKGSGKTALASKLLLMGKTRWDWFAEIDQLEDFEFSLLNKTGGIKGDKVGGATSVWKLLLYIRLFSILCKNEKLSDSEPSINGFKKACESYGLMSSPSLVNIVQETSRRGLYAKFKGVLFDIQGNLGDEKKKVTKDPAGLVSVIEETFGRIPHNDSTYILIIDGLDYPLRQGRDNAPFLADLVSATRQVNAYFSHLGINAKVLLLARDEVINVIPDPNLAKRLNDNGIALDWYDRTLSPLETELLKVVERRASLVGFDKSIELLWDEWFPSKIGLSPSVHFILDSTRFIPRDLISFFRCMQELKKPPPFKEDDVFNALHVYSRWFRMELRDAVFGLIPEDVRTSLDGIIGEVGREFQRDEFAKSLRDYGFSEEIAPDHILKELFNTSWIGNIWHRPGRERPSYSFKHRNRTAIFSPRKGCYVHKGLWKALNLV